MYTREGAFDRRLVLVDIENVVGGAVTMAGQVHAAQAAIEVVVSPRPNDHVVLACGRSSVRTVGFEWAGPRRLRFRSGIDGADLELLDILESEHVGERFTEVVLVSGDGIFADAISRLALRNDTVVTVVSRPGACSRRLRMAAKRTLHLDYDPNATMEVA
ncbi:NYN domain-containing protein [Microbacterium sp. YJN-G]|uniref:NYN domain-containing protein n=1 Tax=Microbacterium sp. YJN-G TaxID=2763257 RepID=UPI001877FAE8|nr:NYN domain-containing protein [Microbacterium sp. YJN-G]